MVISADQEWVEELDGEVEVGDQPDYSLPVLLGRQEVAEVVAWGGLPLRALYASGMRAREYLRLGPGDVEGTRVRLEGRRVEVDEETAARLQAASTFEVDFHGLWGEALARAGLLRRFRGRGLTPASLRHAYATHRLERGMNLASLHCLLGHKVMASTLNYEQLAVALCREEYARCHPLSAGQVENRGKQAAGPTPGEVMTLMDAAQSGRDRLIVRVLYATGVRLAELLELRREDLDWQEGRAFVRSGKGGKDRYCLLDPQTLEELKLFVGARLEGPLLGLSSATPVEKLVRRLAVVTGIYAKYAALGKTVSPHSFRHAFATHCYLNGMRPGTLKLLLGHSRVETTRLYLDIPFEFVHANYGRCHPLAAHE